MENRIDFGLILHESEVTQFAELLGLEATDLLPSPEGLKVIITAILGRIPFHNITMLNRQARSPLVEEIREDMLNGIGGPCGTMNPFIGAFLTALGYHCHLIAGTMMRKDCHLALLVHIGSERYFIDCGDGRPFFDPVNIETDGEYKHPVFHYRLTNHGKQFLVERRTNGKWLHYCTYSTSSRSFSYFRIPIQKHYTTLDFGPFQKGFRLLYYPNGKMMAIRDNLLIREEQDGCSKRYISSIEDFRNILELYFPFPQLDFEKAIAVLASRAVKPFDKWKSDV